MIFYYFDEIIQFISAHFEKSERLKKLKDTIENHLSQLRMEIGVISILWFGFVNPMWLKL